MKQTNAANQPYINWTRGRIFQLWQNTVFYSFIITGRHKKVLNCLETKVLKVNQLEQIYFSLFAYIILGALKIPSKAACSHWSAQNIARLLLFQKKKNGKYEMSKTLVFCIIYPIGF